MGLYNFIQSCFTALFPSRCPYCNSVIYSNEKMCNDCYDKCTVENIFTTLNTSKNISPYRYDGIFSKAIKDFKFYGYFNYGEQLAYVMVDSIKNAYSDISFDYIAYVPISKKKKRKRGYNQSELLAKHISRCLNVPCKDILLKIKENKTQHTLNRIDRAKNVKECFSCNNKIDINNKNILLIDDILTTGATLNECVSALNKGGAKTICCATFATVI